MAKGVEDKEVFLAMTALEEFWDQSMPIIFLGNWCLRYSRKHIWEKFGAEAIYHGWKSSDEFKEDCLYIDQIYEESLVSMSSILNQIHDTKFSVLYWRIMIGPWLKWYIATVYDHYRSLKYASSEYPRITTLGLDSRDYIVPIDTLDFVMRCKEDSYHLQIYTKIAIRMGWKLSFKRHMQSGSYCKNTVTGIKKYMHMVSKSIYGKYKEKIVCNSEYFPKKTFLQLSLYSKFKIAKYYPENNNKQNSITANRLLREKYNLAKRQEGIDDFQRMLFDMIVEDLPFVFLEDFIYYTSDKTINLTDKPRAILSANAWYFDEEFKYWAAYWRECGVPLLGIQHGGNYGSVFLHESERHERKITDKYYSWGWQEEEVQPMPANKLVESRNIGADARKRGILFVTTSESRYFNMMSSPAYHFSNYINSQFIFIKSLSGITRKELILRHHREDMGWDYKDRLQDIFPEIYLDDWSIPFLERLNSCRVYTCDHLSTTFLEALTANVPTILFWRQDDCTLREEAKMYYDQLHKVGILHYSPEDAAKWTEKVYCNVEEWWNDSELQSVREKFCGQFAKKSEKYIKEWVNALMGDSGGGF